MKRITRDIHPWTYIVLFGIALIVIAPVACWVACSRVAEVAEAAAYKGPTRQVFVDGPITPLDFHQYTDLDTACGLDDHGTYTVPAGAHLAFIIAEDQNVRWRDSPRVAGDTVDPTAAIGMPLPAGDPLWYPGKLDHIEFIEEAAGAVLNVAFYGM